TLDALEREQVRGELPADWRERRIREGAETLVRELERGLRVVPSPAELELGVRDGEIVFGFRAPPDGLRVRRAALRRVEPPLELRNARGQAFDSTLEIVDPARQRIELGAQPLVARGARLDRRAKRAETIRQLALRRTHALERVVGLALRAIESDVDRAVLPPLERDSADREDREDQRGRRGERGALRRWPRLGVWRGRRVIGPGMAFAHGARCVGGGYCRRDRRRTPARGATSRTGGVDVTRRRACV